jgi:hypothetical protein
MILTSIPNHLQKSRKTNGGKASAIKSRKNTAAPQKKPPSHESTSEKLPSHQSISEKLRNHRRRNYRRRNHLASTTEKSVEAQYSNLVQPPKPPTIKKMVEPISKRKLAWEMTEEEGKTMIGSQHVHEFFNNINTKQQWRELEKTKQVDPSKLRFSN